MSDRPFKSQVERGILYLDYEYPNWWRTIDLNALDMSDALYHVMSQITQMMVYETNELLSRPYEWLRQHGFITFGGDLMWEQLTQEWRLRVGDRQRGSR